MNLSIGNPALSGNKSVLHARAHSISHQPSASNLLGAKTEMGFNGLTSPSNVRMNARRESEMIRTENNLKSSFAKPYDMTLEDHVKISLAVPNFGMDLYKPENLLLNPKALQFQQQKFKRETFMVAIPKLTKIVPGPEVHSQTYDWAKKDPSHTQKIVKGPVNSFIDQIVRKNKSPEKSTPAPHAYNNLENWKKGNTRITGNQKFNEARTTFIDI